jgi:predicted nucleotidyltransferase
LERAIPVTTADLDELIRKVREILKGVPELAAAWVYGSVAAGLATPISDVDVAVLPEATVEPSRRGELLRLLIVQLERRCPGRPFQVRFFDELPAALRGRIVTSGVRVADRNPALRVEAEVKARMEYHDFLPFERQGTREGLRGLRQKVRRG